MKFGSRDSAEEQGRAKAKSMVRDTMRELLLTDPEFRDSIRPVLKSIIREILHELSSLVPAKKGTESLFDLLLTAACHTAVRGHAKLGREEIEELMRRLAELHRAATCPHGRPIFYFLSRSELNKQFKR